MIVSHQSPLGDLSLSLFPPRGGILISANLEPSRSNYQNVQQKDSKIES